MSEMQSVLRELISVLKLEAIEENFFRGESQDLGWGRIFGGQVVGQALSAAEQTVPDPWYAAANISWPLVLAGVLGFACLALSLLISSR